MFLITRIAFIIVVIISNQYVIAQTINVPADYPTIQSGLSAALSGDTVLVQPGTYVENIFWPNVNGIRLLSAGDSTNTTIDGNNTGSVLNFSTDTTIAKLDSNTIVKGFQIRNGGSVSNGSGIFINNHASPKLVELKVTNNRSGGIYIGNFSNPILRNIEVAGNNEGGIAIESGSNPILAAIEVVNNTSSSRGGGIRILSASNPILTNILISQNTSSNGGAGITIEQSNPTLKYVEIRENRITNNNRFGGGLAVLGSSPYLENITVINNRANRGGGGIWIAVDGSAPEFRNLIVTGNVGSLGGGIASYESSPIFNKALIERNISGNSGGGIYFGSLG